MSSATPSPVRLAAIDIGTNSIRLAVAEIEGGGTYRVLDEEREMTRLGHRLFETGRLHHAEMEHSIAALKKMKLIADGFEVADLRAVATSAVREAANGRAFCREVRRRCGLKIDVISAEEEAQLVLQSALRHFDCGSQALAVVDIGGGSMEVVFAAGGVVEEVHSLPLGAVRLTERYAKSDPLRRRHWRKLRRAIDRALEEGIGKAPFHPELIIGSGGTFTNLAEMDRAERPGARGNIHGYALSRAEVVHLMHRLRVTPLDVRRQTPGLNPERADIIVSGAAAVARLAKRLGTPKIIVNERGLRDGLLLSMIAERGDGAKRSAGAAAPWDRMEGVRAFARTCRSNERHCEHVALLSGELFDGLARRYALPPESRDLLVAAGLLHDVGYLINHAKHHKHAYHLIMHGNLEGFTAREVEIVANVARYHRRAMPKRSHPTFARLERADQRLVRRLAGILRVADGLDRTHTQRIGGVTVRATRGRIRVLLDARSNPQVEIWDAERKSELFEKAYDARVTLAWSEGRSRRRLRVLGSGRGARPLARAG